MSTREQAIQLINTLNDRQLKLLINLINSFKNFVPPERSAKQTEAGEEKELEKPTQEE